MPLLGLTLDPRCSVFMMFSSDLVFQMFSLGLASAEMLEMLLNSGIEMWTSSYRMNMLGRDPTQIDMVIDLLLFPFVPTNIRLCPSGHPVLMAGWGVSWWTWGQILHSKVPLFSGSLKVPDVGEDTPKELQGESGPWPLWGRYNLFWSLCYKVYFFNPNAPKQMDQKVVYMEQ